MKNEVIRWETKDGDTKIGGEFEYPMPENVSEAIEMWGENTTLLGAKKSVTIFIQAYARRQATKAENPMSVSEIAEKAPAVKPEFTEREYTDPVEKYLAGFEKMNDEQKAKLVSSLKEMLAGATE